LTLWAFVLAIAYLPAPLGFLAWIALARPLAILAELQGKALFKAAYFYFLMSYVFQLYWVAIVTPPGAAAAILILSLYPAAIMAVFGVLYRHKKIWGLIALPFLWVGVEYFRSLSEFAFPWTDLAYSQGYYLTFIQIISVIGSYGLSFILIGLNIFVWQALSKNSRLEVRVNSTIAFIATIAAVFAYGWAVFPPYQEKGNYRVALLQGNVDLETKWTYATRDYNFELYDSLAAKTADESPGLIIWPETAAPCYPRLEPKYANWIGNTAKKTGAYHLVGALEMGESDGKKRSFNSAFQFSPDGRMSAAYNKVKLVPFSEHVPYQDYFPFLTREFLENYLTFIKTYQVEWWSDFYPGDSAVVFETDSLRYSVLICFESAFPEYVRECLFKGAEFLVNITNDTWFGRSPGPFQHLRIAVFRAVENRVWIARCANSGISCIIDPYGRETAGAGLFKQAVITSELAPLDEYSIYTKTGPIIGKMSFYITIIIAFSLAVIWLWRRYFRKSTA
jgi:apolipoprotein N-acyltransferase